MSIFGKSVVGTPALDGVRDVTLNPIFASVAADLEHIPGNHYGPADVAPYATPVPAAEIPADTERPRNSKGQYVTTKEQA